MAPERNASLMPRTRQNGILAFRTIDGEEVERLVVGVGQTYGHDDMAGTYVGETSERLLNPKLLQLYLATALLLLLELDRFFCLIFYRRTGAAVLKLNLRTQRPALAKVIT